MRGGLWAGRILAIAGFLVLLSYWRGNGSGHTGFDDRYVLFTFLLAALGDIAVSKGYRGAITYLPVLLLGFGLYVSGALLPYEVWLRQGGP